MKSARVVFACLTLASLLLVASASAQVSIGYGTYFEDFDSMGTGVPSYPTGWNGIKVSGDGALDAGSAITTSTSPAFTTGNTTTATIYNFGSGADRALGSVASGATIPAFGVILQNSTGAVLSASEVSIAFRAEQWRTGSDASANETWTFEWKVGGAIELNDSSGWNTLPSLDMSEILTSTTTNAAVDGNVNFQNVSVASFAGLTWNDGDLLALRWRDSNDGLSDAGMAIDNFSFTAIPEPSTYAAIFGAVTLGIVVLRRRFAKSGQ